MNFHASALILGDRGLIIAGPSGSGKTSLCLALVNHCGACGVFARFVADDQIFLSKTGDRLIASAPATIAGRIEVRGFEPSMLRHESKMVVDAMIRVVPANDATRYREEQAESLAGASIPVLSVAAQNTLANTQAALAWFKLPPFDTTQAPDSAL